MFIHSFFCGVSEFFCGVYSAVFERLSAGVSTYNGNLHVFGCLCANFLNWVSKCLKTILLSTPFKQPTTKNICIYWFIEHRVCAQECLVSSQSDIANYWSGMHNTALW